ncbi:MAG: tRNA (adenosine(37)-N6)-threonylcarbamoyltransferase complex ATPase subunit type 1 TsaE [Roseobacter sp.]
MPQKSTYFDLDSPDETARFAASLGATLTEGDIILLTGDVGAGKTHFARYLIQSILTTPEDVPSPTFTLVQTYDTHAGMLWHADLYRLSSTQEIEELGLVDAFESAICLVEWPDRLGTLAPDKALSLTFADGQTDNARRVTAAWSVPIWSERLAVWKAA